MQNLNFYLVTDTHFFDPSFKRSGAAYEKRSISDQKCVAETPAIIDAGFKQIADDKETNIILIPGDLVYRGEYQSHVGLRNRLYKLKEQGKKIYLITARHDYDDNDSFEFDGDKMLPVKAMPRDELRDFYKDFGFDGAISEHKESMSYVAQLADGIRLLALNCDGDCKDFKGLWDNQMKWALEQIEDAHRTGNYIFAMTHYPLLPFSPIMNLISDSHLTDWEKRANQFADAGLDLIFTGHMHAQAVTEYVTENGNKITDVQTGCFVGCPCAYRKVTIKDSMIDYKMKEILPNPAIKILNKLTVKKICNFLWFNPDKSMQNILAKDLGIELVRNIFIGNEPYVKGTAVYEAFEKLINRLSLIIHIAEKKAGKKNKVLSDIKSFLLCTIGDEKQRDWDLTLDINRKSF